MQFWKKSIKYFNVVLLVIGLLIPLLLFLNRFLIPDVSFDSLNYHLFLGQRGIETENKQFEFYPTGIHNFSSILEIPGFLLMKMFGYRIGSISTLIFLYLSIIVLYKIFRLFQPKYKILNQWWWGFFFVSCFLSYEAFLQIAIYFTDIQVAFLTLLSLYLLLKFEKNKRFSDLILSAISLGVLFLGKMTAGFFFVPYFGYLFVVLLENKSYSWQQRINRLLLTGIIAISFSFPSFLKNYELTRNPIFPYYNTIFKSKLYPEVSYTQESSGGDTVLDKIFWGVISIWRSEKLGQAHDLFNDYKINIYFITTILIIFWSIKKRDKSLLKLSILYLVTYEVWAWVFGYLRYGIALELWGGLILLLWFTKIKSIKKYFIVFPLFVLMVLQNKRVVNLALAYDLSFRPGYFYNRQTYIKELKNINTNMIEVDEKYIKENNPKIYLNCAVPSMSYYVLSDFNKLPVLNIDEEFYAGMSKNKKYEEFSTKLLKDKYSEKKINFVTIVANSGLNTNYEQCLKNLKSRNIKITKEIDSNFLNYENQKLKIIFGEINW